MEDFKDRCKTYFDEIMKKSDAEGIEAAQARLDEILKREHQEDKAKLPSILSQWDLKRYSLPTVLNTFGYKWPEGKTFKPDESTKDSVVGLTSDFMFYGESSKEEYRFLREVIHTMTSSKFSYFPVGKESEKAEEEKAWFDVCREDLITLENEKFDSVFAYFLSMEDGANLIEAFFDSDNETGVCEVSDKWIDYALEKKDFKTATLILKTQKAKKDAKKLRRSSVISMGDESEETKGSVYFSVDVKKVVEAVFDFVFPGGDKTGLEAMFETAQDTDDEIVAKWCYETFCLEAPMYAEMLLDCCNLRKDKSEVIERFKQALLMPRFINAIKTSNVEYILKCLRYYPDLLEENVGFNHRDCPMLIHLIAKKSAGSIMHYFIDSILKVENLSIKYETILKCFEAAYKECLENKEVAEKFIVFSKMKDDIKDKMIANASKDALSDALDRGDVECVKMALERFPGVVYERLEDEEPFVIQALSTPKNEDEIMRLLLAKMSDEIRNDRREEIISKSYRHATHKPKLVDMIHSKFSVDGMKNDATVSYHSYFFTMGICLYIELRRLWCYLKGKVLTLQFKIKIGKEDVCVLQDYTGKQPGFSIQSSQNEALSRENYRSSDEFRLPAFPEMVGEKVELSKDAGSWTVLSAFMRAGVVTEVNCLERDESFSNLRPV